MFDPNTCLFLVGMNWAAVDVVKITKAMNALNKEDEGGYQEKFNKYLGRFGAAFSVLFTGIYHTKYQLLFMMKSSNKRRLYTLAVFSLFPMCAMLGTYKVLKDATPSNIHRHYPKTPSITSMTIPALYWRNMEYQGHLISMWFAWLTPTPIILVQVFIATFLVLSKYLPQPMPNKLHVAYKWAMENVETLQQIWGFSLPVSFCIGFLGDTISEKSGNPTWNWAWALGGPSFYILALLYLETHFPMMAIWYTFSAYFHIGSNVSDSCYFMPCSPYSLLDSDQLMALVLGLVAVVAVEGPLIWKYVKRLETSNRIWTASMEQRFSIFNARRATSDTETGIALR